MVKVFDNIYEFAEEIFDDFKLYYKDNDIEVRDNIYFYKLIEVRNDYSFTFYVINPSNEEEIGDVFITIYSYGEEECKKWYRFKGFSVRFSITVNELYTRDIVDITTSNVDATVPGLDFEILVDEKKKLVKFTFTGMVK
jgi:hypothetical protein